MLYLSSTWRIAVLAQQVYSQRTAAVVRMHMQIGGLASMLKSAHAVVRAGGEPECQGLESDADHHGKHDVRPSTATADKHTAPAIKNQDITAHSCARA